MKNILTLLFLSLFIVNLLAQSSEKTTSYNFNCSSPDWDDYDFDFDFWTGDSRPFMEFNYGFGNLKQNDYTDLFSDIGNMELKLGYSIVDSWDNNILDFKENYMFGSRLSDRVLSSPEIEGKITTDSWRFGFAERSGFGYQAGSFAFLPYYSRGCIWTSVKVTDGYYRAILDQGKDAYPDDPISDMFNRYDGTLRFGQISEAGLNIRMGSLFSVGAGYEFSVVYPRHVFWKDFISFAIEGAGQGALNLFIDEVMDGSPAAGPIVSFLLKNGLSYAFFTLRKENMNWPYTTETPLTYETFKVNMTFNF